MGRPKKSAIAAKKAAEKKHLPASKSSSTVVDGVARVKKFYEIDLNGYSDGYLVSSDRAGAHFTTWLESIGTSLAALAEVADRHSGQPVMCELIVALWVETRAESIKTSAALKHLVNSLALWLRRNGWDTSRLDGSSTSGKKLRNAIDSMRAHKPKHITTQARPYSPEEIDRIVAAIDDNTFDWNELTVQAMRTYSIVGFAMAMRGGELCHTLRWDMVDINNEVFNLPGGRIFKHQDEPSSAQIPHNHSPKKKCGANCPVGVLKAWKTTCSNHGIPTIDTLVFPAIRQKAGWNAKSTVAFFGASPFIADPVAHAITLKGGTPKVRAKSRDTQHDRYTRRWKEACEAAGVQADHQWERASTHGMRRGAATTAVRNGIPEATVSQRLRHNDIETTSIYVQRQAADTASLNFISPAENESLTNTEMVGADALRKTCQVTYDGVACGKDYAKNVVIEGEQVPACSAHWSRYQKRKTGDELTKPTGTLNRHEHDGKCEVTHNGVACGKDFHAHIDIDGVCVPGCVSHRRRQKGGKTGDDLTKPIRAKRKPA